MHFSTYLLDNEFVTADELESALREQQTLRPTLGQLAMERGWISRKGIFQILTSQNETSQKGKRFGDIAVGLDLLTDLQVAELVLAQNNPTNFIGEILVSQNVLSVPSLIK
ncbi:MAG: hypothetical protein HON77_03225, partial [Gammaproteobacteria bacterium]|nr:hypothetical protein [Gammaproteobacteria bacterium]